MKVTPIKTPVIRVSQCNLTALLAEAVKEIPESSVLAITSKIVSLCEGSAVSCQEGDKDLIIRREADYYLPKRGNKYDVYLTIKHNMLIPNAGVDESNTGGLFVLWPRDPQASANGCWKFLKERFRRRKIGVMITDSTSAPLRWGTTGKCIAYCGFKGVNSKIGESDLFGRKLRMTRINVADGLAAAAVVCMGEADEQTPLALLEDLPFVEFCGSPPSMEELDGLHIEMEDDLYGQLIANASWRRYKKD
ncbi:MAG: coenzyme F420-0:L-glutamate ligase [Bacillota bacterium]